MGHGGAIMAQLYVGTSSHLTAVFPMSSESQMHATLMDFIRMHGAPNMLLSDNAKTQISSKVIDILRHYHIKQHRSEPYYQNLAEQRIQDCKHLVNNIMDRTGTPAKFWLLCLEYAVLHHTCEVKDTKTPLEKAHGQPVDVSALMQFRWFEPVLYHAPDASFPSESTESTEKLGRWVGVADHVGDALTYLILDDASQLVVPRSVVRTALSAQHPNLRATTPQQDGEESGGVITSVTDMLPPSVDPAVSLLHELLHWLPHELPHELLGKTLHTTQDGEQGTSDQESQRF